MTIKQKFEALAKEENTPCVTISLNTHRTHPENEQDKILLKNLLDEAEDRVINEFGKRDVSSLLDNMESLDIDADYNLDSLHIFLSNDTKEVIRSPWPTQQNRVQVANKFGIRSLIKSVNRSKEYMILVLSQGGVELYNAVNDGIIREIKNDDFPFDENPHYVTDRHKNSDGELRDNMILEYFNTVDKAVQKVYNEKKLSIVIVCTDENYNQFMKVADRPNIYVGHSRIDYNKTKKTDIAEQAWKVRLEVLKERKDNAITEVRESVSKGLVLTDLQEIYRAALDGQGDILIVANDYSQAVMMNGARNFDLIEDETKPGAIDDITSLIAWEVLSKNGKVYFGQDGEVDDIGKVILKTRY